MLSIPFVVHSALEGNLKLRINGNEFEQASMKLEERNYMIVVLLLCARMFLPFIVVAFVGSRRNTRQWS